MTAHRHILVAHSRAQLFVVGIGTCLVLATGAARADERFAPQTFAASANETACGREILGKAKEVLIRGGLRLDAVSADVTLEVECSEQTIKKPLRGSPADNTFDTVRHSSLFLSTRYGGRKEIKGSFDEGRLKAFLAAHSNGCEIRAQPPQAFRLSVAAEGGGANAVELDLETPFTVRGLSPGQPMAVKVGERASLNGCPPGGIRHLESQVDAGSTAGSVVPAAAGSGGSTLPAAAGSGGNVPPGNGDKIRWWVIVVAAAALLMFGLAMRSSQGGKRKARKIFISYRRDDAGGHAGRLASDLRAKLGAANVFVDVLSIRLGEAFLFAINNAIANSKTVLAVIGPDWLAAVEANGTIRLDDPKDVLRIEISTAMKLGIEVIPVLVGGASLPSEQRLPAELRPLVQLQAIELRSAHWDHDLKILLATIGRGGPAVQSEAVSK